MSMKSIARHLEVSSGSVHLWTSDIELKPEDRVRLAHGGHRSNLLKARTALEDRHLRNVQQDREDADREWLTLRLDPVFFFGLALYIGEGSKTDTTVGVTNVDPAVLRASLRFFQRIGLEMTRLKVHIILHRGEDPDAALRYWSTELALPLASFDKVTASKVSGGKRARHLVHGTASVRMSASRVKRKLNRWMELARLEFGPRGTR